MKLNRDESQMKTAKTISDVFAFMHMRFLSKDIKLSLSLSLILHLFFSCSYRAPITVPLYTSRLDSPEMSNKPHGVSLGLSVKYPNEIIIVPDGIATPPEFFDPRLSTEKLPPYISPHLGVNITNRLEFSYDIYSGAMLKAQLFGKRREQSHVGNQCAALSVGYSYSLDSDNRTKSNRPNSDYILAEYDWRMNTLRSNLILGNRFHENILYYYGAYYESYSLSGQLDQYSYPGIIDTNEEYVLSGTGYRRGVGMGVEFTFEAEGVKQSIVYTLQISDISWGSYSSDYLLNHSVVFRYYL